MAYDNTKFVYIENKFKSAITNLYADLLEKQILAQKLTMATY